MTISAAEASDKMDKAARFHKSAARASQYSTMGVPGQSQDRQGLYAVYMTPPCWAHSICSGCSLHGLTFKIWVPDNMSAADASSGIQVWTSLVNLYTLRCLQLEGLIGKA